MPAGKKTDHIRVGVYARVSTAEQDVGMQVSEIRQVAKQRGWRIIEEYTDAGISGVAVERPALNKMMEDARRGKFDLLAQLPQFAGRGSVFSMG